MVRTAFLKDIPFDREDVRRSFFQFANGAASYAWVHAPAELAVRFSQPDVAESLAGRLAWFQSTVYVTETNAGWLPEFFGQLAILQPIDAEWQADVLAPVLGAHPDFSEISNSGSDHTDQILRVAQTTYMSAGREPSRWRGSHEFVDAVERVGRNDLCFGTGDTERVVFETPIGLTSALITLRSDVRHPGLGSGLIASLHWPFTGQEAEITNQCTWLNLLESTCWSEVPQVGGWFPQDLGNGVFRACSQFFVPNALYRPGLAANIALWQLCRARWVKLVLCPDLKDLTMAEILAERYGSPAAPN
jgi:hypothetical protein